MTWISESITASFGHVISGHWLPSVRKTICLARFGKMAKTLGGNFQFGHLRDLDVKQIWDQFRYIEYWWLNPVILNTGHSWTITTNQF